MHSLSTIVPVSLVLVNLVILLVLLLRRPPKTDPAAGRMIQQELRQGREESNGAARGMRDEIALGMKNTGDSITKMLGELTNLQKVQLEGVASRLEKLTDSNQNAIRGMRDTLDERMRQLQEKNEKKLDEMRAMVDEKLQATLEKRLGDSFSLVSERLEAVQRGLGEMQSLAGGVGDLKRVLTNVKARGTWGEYQLGAILEQVLTQAQYGKNVQTKDDSRDLVEYAVKLPGRNGGEDGSPVWLPIDSKFPQEDYQRLLVAVYNPDKEAVDRSTAALIRAIRLEAKKISDTYLNPPVTTDFAVMFLPTEGLYAEVLRQPGIVDEIQRDCHVVIAGPTTLSALLSSLCMGFRTLAIEQRAGEVWKTLGAIKTEFGKFGILLDRAKKQLNAASSTLDQTSTRSRVMERKLKDVEKLPSGDLQELLELEPVAEDVPEIDFKETDGPVHRQ